MVRIRFQGYCDQFGVEPPERCPNTMGSGEYDDHARRCLIAHRPSGLPAACGRLVPAGASVVAERRLPFERHCWYSLDPASIGSLNLDPGR
nr:hypothetical protein [Desulfobacterales bacterium]